MIPWNLHHWQWQYKINAGPHLAKGNPIHESFPVDSHVPTRSWRPLLVMLPPGLNLFLPSYGAPSLVS